MQAIDRAMKLAPTIPLAGDGFWTQVRKPFVFSGGEAPDRSPPGRPPGGRRTFGAGEARQMSETMEMSPGRGADAEAVSVLFDRPLSAWPAAQRGDYAVDLRLDDIVAWLTMGRAEYELRDLFFAPCPDTAAIAWRQAVFADLAAGPLAESLAAVAEAMRTVRRRYAMAARAEHRHERELRLLEAVEAYLPTVRALATALAGALARAELRSPALRRVEEYARALVGSEELLGLESEARALRAALDAVVFRVRIAGLQMVVSRFGDEPDYGAELVEAFERFRSGSVEAPKFEAREDGLLDHVEAAALRGVARLCPDLFADLDRFATAHAAFIDPVLRRFDREIQFYLAVREQARTLAGGGRSLGPPEVSAEQGPTIIREAYDLALAARLAARGRPVVANDLELGREQRMVVVTGPNQGGKTTFARAIGQVHHLARLGCPVPASAARVSLVDAIHTHFERREEREDLAGKLEDDLRRIRNILDAAGPRSLLVMNESFSSTTTSDALFLNELVLGEARRIGLLAVVVTFLDELASLTPTTVSMVAEVDPDDPARRTFRLERRPADGLAYAHAIARKHRLAYEQVRDRVAAR